MKKLIAVLLTAAMLLGCVACTSEETTKKKKKTKKTTEKTEETVDPSDDPTDDPGTDPTDEPTDTSDTTAISDTSDPAVNTTKAPGGASELVISNDLDSLGALTSGDCLAYGALDPTGELVLPGNLPVQLHFYWETLTTSNGSAELNEELEGLCEQIKISTVD
ncbi:MAG: hypothetical protein J5750_06980, partial [Clostridiales bacterium]|nr:hypothetical protein [Clostridiales bacterium]